MRRLSASVTNQVWKMGWKWKVVINNEPHSRVRLLSPAPPFLMKHGGRQNLEGPGTWKLKLITVWATKLLPWRCGRDGFYLISFSSYFCSSPLSIFGFKTRATRTLFPVQSRWLEQNIFNASICPHFISINMARSQARLLSIYLSLVQPSSP